MIRLENDVDFTVYVKVGQNNLTETKYDYKCELPNKDPEKSYCGLEAFRNENRPEFSKIYQQLKEHNTQDLLNYFQNESLTRCQKAFFKILHPFTCIVPQEIIKKYAKELIFILHEEIIESIKRLTLLY